MHHDRLAGLQPSAPEQRQMRGLIRQQEPGGLGVIELRRSGEDADAIRDRVLRDAAERQLVRTSPAAGSGTGTSVTSSTSPGGPFLVTCRTLIRLPFDERPCDRNASAGFMPEPEFSAGLVAL
jgi:hypothetical protein